MPLTPEDVRNKQFTTVRLREGYDEDEVDAFLDEVEAELTRLLRENEDLRAKLAAATRAAAQNQANMRKEQQAPQDGGRPGAPVPAAISGPPVPGQQQGPGPQQLGGPQQLAGPQQGMGNQPLGLPSGAPQLPAGQGGPMGGPMGNPMQQQMGQTMGGQQQLVQPMGGQMLQPMGNPMQQQMGQTMGGQQLQPMGGQQLQPMGAPMGNPMQQQQGPGGDSAARVLALAQQTADQAISEARSEANKIVGEARSRAEGLERDARAKADALERDAQEKHRVAMGSLESARATLERKVEDLRAFEREYRTRLKSYLETQLRQLESQADDSLAPPRIPATASLPPAASSMAPAGAGAMSSSAPSFGSTPSFGGNQSFGGSSFGSSAGTPSFGGASASSNGAMAPAGMTQPMAAVRPQPPQPMQQAPAPMRGFLIDEDGDN
ncbi:cell division protein DivIVA [Kitasatospora griseola]|uniref:Cell wall synthesis protein Wag31 n=2 Tax=Kitasatospora griseola TaxID=2064 RepID=A0A0D0PH81_KITGR|nr:DivIVA domain-containing protein [Kitasatospora griseola]KIQ61774.1 cell division protein DivIVA [Kitasatospora griseola]